MIDFPRSSSGSCEGLPQPSPTAETSPGSGQLDPFGMVGTPADIDAVHEVLTTEYAAAYAGLTVCGASALAVYRLPDRGLDETGLQARFPDVALVFFDGEVSEADGEALMNRVEADFEMWQTRGVHITSMHAELDGRVQIGIRGEVTSEITSWFTEAYGPGVDVKHRRGMVPL